MKILFLFLTWYCAWGASKPADWEGAKKAFEEKNYATALEKMQAIRVAERESGVTPSPESSYNLGMALWNLERAHEAVAPIISSAWHRTYSWDRLQDLAVVSELQKELGIKESLPEWPLFQAYFAIGKSYPVWAWSLCLWFLAFAGVAAFFRPTHWKWMVSTLSALTLVVGITTIAWQQFSQRHFRLAVVQLPDHAKGEVPLYRTAGEKEEEKLVELPAGTLVNIDRTREGYTAINAPLVGWLPTQNLATLD